MFAPRCRSESEEAMTLRAMLFQLVETCNACQLSIYSLSTPNSPFNTCSAIGDETLLIFPYSEHVFYSKLCEWRSIAGGRRVLFLVPVCWVLLPASVAWCVCIGTSNSTLSQLCAESAPSLSDLTAWPRPSDLQDMTLLKWTRGHYRPHAHSGAPVLSVYPLVSLRSLVPQKLFLRTVPTQIPCITDCMPSCQWVGSRCLDSLCATNHQPQLTCIPEGGFLIPGSFGPALARASFSTIQWATAIPSPMRSNPSLGSNPLSTLSSLEYSHS